MTTVLEFSKGTSSSDILKKLSGLEAEEKAKEIARLKQQSAAPSAPKANTQATAGFSHIRFSFDLVDESVVDGYAIYRGIVNSSDIAALIDYKSQPTVNKVSPLHYSDVVDSGTYWYWVSAVNSAGKESPRVAMQTAATSPLAESAYEPQDISTASVDLTSVAATTILDVTEAGKILGIAIRVSATVSGTVPVATLDITTDGGTERNISLYASALTWAVGVRGFSRGSGEDGDGAGDRVMLPGDVIYSKSMKVSVDVTTAAGTAGTLQVSVFRAKKV